jgi:hypothetical protein
LPDNRQNANPAPYRPQVQTARQAAEALFRPKPQVTAVEAHVRPAASPIPSTEPDAPRKPGILSATPVTSDPAKEPEAAVSPALTKGPTAPRQRAQKIPKTAHGRIKTLTMYGMTVEDVADLYGVPVSDIARIVSTTSRLMPLLESAA